jgi:GTPase
MFEKEIKKQVNIAIDEADVILFLVDVQTGISELDMDVAAILRACKKPVLLVANKTDENEFQYQAAEFYRLGIGDPYCVSAATGFGTGDLLDAIVPLLSEREIEYVDDSLPRIAIVGRPNAGKSSLLNSLMDEERNIVTDVAGTTRDSIYTKYNKYGKEFYLVDTAGIRKKAKVNEDLEFYSVMRAIRTIENSDVCIMMIDATRGIESQDQNIFSLIQKNKKGLVVCVNKWDLVENKEQKAITTFENAIRERFAPFVDFPIVFTSATTKQRIFKVIDVALEVYGNKKRRIGTNKLNEFILPLIENYPPPALKGKYIKIKYVTQLPDTYVPTFVFFANLPQYIKDPYKRFLENKIRETWDFTGIPLQLFFRAKSTGRK